jgi:hypothetical protein
MPLTTTDMTKFKALFAFLPNLADEYFAKATSDAQRDQLLKLMAKCYADYSVGAKKVLGMTACEPPWFQCDNGACVRNSSECELFTKIAALPSPAE